MDRQRGFIGSDILASDKYEIVDLADLRELCVEKQDASELRYYLQIRLEVFDKACVSDHGNCGAESCAVEGSEFPKQAHWHTNTLESSWFVCSPKPTIRALVVAKRFLHSTSDHQHRSKQDHRHTKPQQHQ